MIEIIFKMHREAVEDMMEETLFGAVFVNLAAVLWM